MLDSLDHDLLSEYVWAINSTGSNINESLNHLVRQWGNKITASPLAADGQGQQGFSYALGTTVGITDTEATAFMRQAAAFNARFVSLDQQARTIIEQAREHVAKGEILPPVPAELKSLQVQKDLLKSSLETRLKGALRGDTYN